MAKDKSIVLWTTIVNASGPSGRIKTYFEKCGNLTTNIGWDEVTPIDEELVSLREYGQFSRKI